jgi:hypothetical protein
MKRSPGVFLADDGVRALIARGVAFLGVQLPGIDEAPLKELHFVGVLKAVEISIKYEQLVG